MAMRFKRIDLEGEPNYRGRCPIRGEHATLAAQSREKEGVKIQTSEHVMAALVGMEIDNVLIELDAPGTSDNGRFRQVFCGSP